MTFVVLFSRCPALLIFTTILGVAKGRWRAGGDGAASAGPPSLSHWAAIAERADEEEEAVNDKILMRGGVATSDDNHHHLFGQPA